MPDASLQQIHNRLAKINFVEEGKSPFTLPDGNVQIAVSGGRTSAMMLYYIMKENGDFPDRVRVTFQNTGRERPETLNFLREISEQWGVDIVWLEYCPEKPYFRIVDHSTARQDGKPFQQLIEKKKYLPNQQTRFCTIELKIRTAKRYLRSIGWENWTNAAGFRFDETSRVIKPPPKDRWSTWYPLWLDKQDKWHVDKFWQRHSFHLQLPSIRGKTPTGNCDGGFLKAEATIAALTRDEPDRAAWWEYMETKGTKAFGDGATFSKRYSRKSMRKYIEDQGDWIFDAENNGAVFCQADEGECLGHDLDYEEEEDD